MTIRETTSSPQGDPDLGGSLHADRTVTGITGARSKMLASFPKGHEGDEQRFDHHRIHAETTRRRAVSPRTEFGPIIRPEVSQGQTENPPPFGVGFRHDGRREPWSRVRGNQHRPVAVCFSQKVIGTATRASASTSLAVTARHQLPPQYISNATFNPLALLSIETQLTISNNHANTRTQARSSILVYTSRMECDSATI